jgi:hypothetical protein
MIILKTVRFGLQQADAATVAVQVVFAIRLDAKCNYADAVHITLWISAH